MPVSFPDCCSQPHSETAVPSLIPRLLFPASFPDCCSQPHSQTAVPSLIPRLLFPASFPDCCSQPHSETAVPSLIPRLLFPASFPDCCSQPHSQTACCMNAMCECECPVYQTIQHGSNEGLGTRQVCRGLEMRSGPVVWEWVQV